MAYQKKHACFQCGGSGKGMTDEWIRLFEKDTNPDWIEWKKRSPCSHCDGKGYNEYDFRLSNYDGVWDDVDWKNFDVDYEDFTAKYICSCGDKLFFNEDGCVVCKCGRVYQLQTKVLVDDSHLNDMEYWEKYEDKSSA